MLKKVIIVGTCLVLLLINSYPSIAMANPIKLTVVENNDTIDIIEDDSYKYTNNNINKKTNKLYNTIDLPGNTEIVSFDMLRVGYIVTLAPKLVVDRYQTVHVLYKGVKNFGDDYLTYYQNKPVGGNWTKPEIVEEIEDGKYIDVAIGIDEMIHIVWVDNENVWYKNKPHGQEWMPREQVSSIAHPLNITFHYPHITVEDNGNVHVLWESFFMSCTEPRGKEYIYYNNKSKGSSWGLTEIIGTRINSWWLPLRYAKDTNSIIVDENGTMHVVWGEYSDINKKIIYKQKPSATEWSSEVTVPTLSDARKTLCELGIDGGGTIHLSWREQDPTTSRCNVAYINKTEEDIWGKIDIVNLEEDLGTGVGKSMVIDNDDTVHIAWVDYGRDIYYKYKQIEKNWSTAELISWISPIYYSYNPYIDVDIEGNIHLIWIDEAPYLEADVKLEDVFYYSPLNRGPIVYIEHLEPHVWEFGINLRLTNIGNEPAINSNWSFDLEKIPNYINLILIGAHRSGTISYLQSKESIEIKNFVFGFTRVCHFNIYTEHTTRFYCYAMFGPFVKFL